MSNSDELIPLFEQAPDLMFTESLSGNITRVNQAFERITGYSREQVLEKSFVDLVVPEHRHRLLRILRELKDGAPSGPQDLVIQSESRGRVALQLTLQLTAQNGSPRVLYGFARDVTARPLSGVEAQLLERTQELARFGRYLQLLHRLSTTNYTNLEDLFADYLSTGCEIFGVSNAMLTKWDGEAFAIRAAYPVLQGEGLTDLDAFALRIVTSNQTITCSRRPEPGGQECPYAFYIGTPIHLQNEVYGTISFWTDEDVPLTPLHSQAREVIELMSQSIAVAIRQHNLTDQLAHQAHHDALTGLPNRMLMKTRLDAALQKAHANKTMVAVVFIDLDRFKQINDTLGHSFGDGLLQQMAQRLKQRIGKGDTLARMGGDEFTAILTDVRDLETAIERVRRLLVVVHKPCVIEGFELFVTASMGVSFFPKDGNDATTLLHNADTAMYVAKNSGKNDLCCFSAEGTETALERIELENYLRRALENDELKIYPQPQVDLCGKLSAVEVLLAWEHPKLGRVSPSLFMPIAEEIGMNLSIGTWVLRQACRQAVEWQRSGHPPIRFAVNVSAQEFSQAGFVESVADILAETGLNPDCLELELTESLVMRDMEQSATRMTELRELGVRIAIDDFGTGYASLSCLSRLPADILKIDQSLLQDIGGGSSRSRLFETIVSLARSMGLSVTVGGVETPEQLQLAVHARCDRVQGHLFGGPLLAEGVEERLVRGFDQAAGIADGSYA